MSLYLVLKQLHIGCVVISGLGFLLRGVWMLGDSPRLAARWVRVWPHVIDTLLLASAVALAVLSGQYPFAVGWLTAKLVGLLAYIVLGAVALRYGRSRTSRTVAFGLAIAAFTYIVSVALSRDPRGAFGLIVNRLVG